MTLPFLRNNSTLGNRLDSFDRMGSLYSFNPAISFNLFLFRPTVIVSVSIFILFLNIGSMPNYSLQLKGVFRQMTTSALQCIPYIAPPAPKPPPQLPPNGCPEPEDIEIPAVPAGHAKKNGEFGLGSHRQDWRPHRLANLIAHIFFSLQAHLFRMKLIPGLTSPMSPAFISLSSVKLLLMHQKVLLS